MRCWVLTLARSLSGRWRARRVHGWSRGRMQWWTRPASCRISWIAPAPNNRRKEQFWHLGLRHWRLRPDATFPAEATPAHVQGANFDHKLALLGWDDPREDQLTVYWRVLNTLPQDYRVSLILEDAQGREVGRWDGRPASYDYPTTRWQPGQEIFGRYPLPLPPDARG